MELAVSEKQNSGGRVKAYVSFTKLKLSISVVLSALTGYLFMGGNDALEITLLILGGTLVTGASNGSNQIWERKFDGMMKRTANRPIPTGVMSLTEAYLAAIIMLLIGEAMLLAINPRTALLGFISYVIYVFVYTPMKRVSPWAVFVGAFPGAMSPLIGAVAASNAFGLIPGILFFVQFVWQFPHFWAIAWVSFEDYKKGGYSLLPSKSGKSKQSAYIIVVYSFFLIPFTLLPWLMGLTGTATLVIGSIISIAFFYLSLRLLKTCEDKAARTLMFASFFYLPVVQFLYVFDKVSPFPF